MQCAIYCRKSTDKGLDQEFNTLDAQREACENYIASQKSQGWECLPDRYEDGGFTGANTNRPAFQRLMADVRAGKVGVIVVYKIDRFSRSLLDFAKIMEALEAHEVALVSVTQSFNSANSMGRLILNVLLSFAQFERETIAERVSDKVAAARRRGKYTGGLPILGYDIVDKKIVPNPLEANQVEQIFLLYRGMKSLLGVVDELRRRGWMNKQWTTRAGKVSGGKPFDKGSLHKLLTNVVYKGLVRHKDQVYEGEHQGIIDADLFEEVQTALNAARKGRGGKRSRHYGLLQRLLRCGECGSVMTHTYAMKNGSKRYRYYICSASSRGRKECRHRSVSATAIEGFAVDRIRNIGSNPALLNEVAADVVELRAQQKEELARALRLVHEERQQLRQEMAATAGELGESAGEDSVARKLAALSERVREVEGRSKALEAAREALRNLRLDRDDLVTALRDFDGVWQNLVPTEQAELLSTLLKRITYGEEAIEIEFQPLGIQLLEPAGHTAEKERKGLAVSYPIHLVKGKHGKKKIYMGKAPEKKSPGQLLRITRVMALAIHFQDRLNDGTYKRQVDIAAKYQISEGRVSQILKLNQLSPKIQEELLFWPAKTKGPDCLAETALKPILDELNWEKQHVMWAALKRESEG